MSMLKKTQKQLNKEYRRKKLRAEKAKKHLDKFSKGFK